MIKGPASHSRVRGPAIAALLVLAPPSAFAHDLWMVPGKYRLDTGETTRVFINDGDVFPESLTLLGQQRITEVNFRGPDGEKTVTDFRVDGKSLTFDIASKVAGTYVLALGTHPRRVRMKADDFRDYLTEEKLDEITKMIEDRKETEQAAVERYAKWAKTVVDVGAPDEAKDGDDSWEEPMGQPFENRSPPAPQSNHSGRRAADSRALSRRASPGGERHRGEGLGPSAGDRDPDGRERGGDGDGLRTRSLVYPGSSHDPSGRRSGDALGELLVHTDVRSPPSSRRPRRSRSRGGGERSKIDKRWKGVRR